MAEFNNSFKARENVTVQPKAPVEKKPVVELKAPTKKKFMDAVITRPLKEIGEDILYKKFIPAAKAFIFETIGSLLFGDGADPRILSSSSYNQPQIIQYNKQYKSQIISSAQFRANDDVYAYEYFFYPTIGAANNVLTLMREQIGRYGQCSVANLYDFAEVTTQNYQTSNFGWSNLDGAQIYADGTGYRLKLPKALPF